MEGRIDGAIDVGGGVGGGVEGGVGGRFIDVRNRRLLEASA